MNWATLQVVYTISLYMDFFFIFAFLRQLHALYCHVSGAPKPGRLIELTVPILYKLRLRDPFVSRASRPSPIYDVIESLAS
jgi:hypothetical protein